MKTRIFTSLAIALLLIAMMVTPAVALVEQPITGTVTVSSQMSITLTGDIDFTDIAPGTTEEPDDDQTGEGFPAISVDLGSETNEPVDIGIKGAITLGNLALDNWEYSKSYAKVGMASITTSYVAVYEDIEYSSNSSVPFYHWITVPVGTDAGTHEVTVSYKIVPADDPFE